MLYLYSKLFTLKYLKRATVDIGDFFIKHILYVNITVELPRVPKDPPTPTQKRITEKFEILSQVTNYVELQL